MSTHQTRDSLVVLPMYLIVIAVSLAPSVPAVPARRDKLNLFFFHLNQMKPLFFSPVWQSALDGLSADGLHHRSVETAAGNRFP